MKTKDKIIFTALDMFNEQGERAVTTNHIAAKLGISPGNLYYHYDNKEEIIRRIFDLYRDQLKDSFQPKAEQQVMLEHMMDYLDAVFSLMWQFRFLYANLAEILARDEQLKAAYLGVQLELDQWVHSVLLQLCEEEFLLLSEEDVPELSHLLRLVLNSWIGYQTTRSQNGVITQGIVYEGVVKVLFVLKPYVKEAKLSVFQDMDKRYRQLTILESDTNGGF